MMSGTGMDSITKTVDLPLKHCFYIPEMGTRWSFFSCVKDCIANTMEEWKGRGDEDPLRLDTWLDDLSFQMTKLFRMVSIHAFNAETRNT